MKTSYIAYNEQPFYPTNQIATKTNVEMELSFFWKADYFLDVMN